MDEQYFQDLLSAYLDNELTPEQKAAMDQYLAGSPEAREQLARLDQLNRLVEDHSELDGEAYWEESAGKIEQRLGIADTRVTAIEPERRKRSGLWWKVTSVAASVAILVFIGLHQTDIMGPGGSKEADESKSVNRVSSLPPAPMDSNRQDVHHAEVSTSATREPSYMAVPTPVKPKQQAVGGTTAKPDTTSGVVRASKDELARVMVGNENMRATVDLATKSDTQYEVKPTPRETPSVKAKPEPATSASLPAPSARVQSEEASDDEVSASKEVEVTADKGIATQSDKPEPEEVNFSLVSGEAELARWRLVRDSLVDQLTTTKDKKAKRRIPGDVAVTSLQATPPDSATSRGREELEGRLADAWYNVLTWSRDSSEMAQGKEFLRRLAADSSSTNRGKAKGYLDELRP
jgi:hypothetical protein